MKKFVSTLTAILGISTLAAQDVVVKGPDEKSPILVFMPKGDFSNIVFPL